jgi:hypothetical protein
MRYCGARGVLHRISHSALQSRRLMRFSFFSSMASTYSTTPASDAEWFFQRRRGNTNLFGVGSLLHEALCSRCPPSRKGILPWFHAPVQSSAFSAICFACLRFPVSVDVADAPCVFAFPRERHRCANSVEPSTWTHLRSVVSRKRVSNWVASDVKQESPATSNMAENHLKALTGNHNTTTVTYAHTISM